LLKLITLNVGSQATEQAKVNLIDAISIATNQQTVVIIADRYSNEELNVEIQTQLFERYGLLYERKRGEFQDGIYQGYITRNDIVERNLFFRILFAANGNIKSAIEKKVFARALSGTQGMPTAEELDRFYFATLISPLLFPDESMSLRGNRMLAVKLYAATTWYRPDVLENANAAAAEAVTLFPPRWAKFMAWSKAATKTFTRLRKDKKTGEETPRFDTHSWLTSQELRDAIRNEAITPLP
jgi:hypothetical protein